MQYETVEREQENRGDLGDGGDDADRCERESPHLAGHAQYWTGECGEDEKNEVVAVAKDLEVLDRITLVEEVEDKETG